MLQTGIKFNLILILLFIFISGIFSGCALMKKPDSCEKDDSCELIQDSKKNLIELKPGEFEIVHICACRPWNASGITVKKGQNYLFKIVSVDNWVDGCVDSDPIKGWQGNFYKVLGSLSGWLKRSDKSSWYALVGSVGKNDKESFAVEETNSWTVKSKKDGELYFYANDMEGRYFNNKGNVMLKVIRQN